jgi:5,10-methylenetetrahydromethanopterin reductase
LTKAQFWLHGFPFPTRVTPLAVQAEAWGYDGLLLADSPMLVGDPYVELTLAARATSTLRLGPGVTNPVTRHPAVTAAALASLHVESGGRAVAVLGRGDSGVLHLGRKPAPTAELERAVVDLRRYLSGTGVPTMDGLPGRLGWFAPEQYRPIPVSVAATGPVTIEMAASHGDAVDLTVGADPERIAWAIGIARAAAARQERTVSVGAFLNVGVADDLDVARGLVRGSAAIFAHFVSAKPSAVASDADRHVLEELDLSYAERAHGLSTVAHSTHLPDDFVDRFTVVGPPEECVRRLRELVAAGVERFVIVPGSRDADLRLVAESNERFAREVMPSLR